MTVNYFCDNCFITNCFLLPVYSKNRIRVVVPVPNVFMNAYIELGVIVLNILIWKSLKTRTIINTKISVPLLDNFYCYFSQYKPVFVYSLRAILFLIFALVVFCGLLLQWHGMCINIIEKDFQFMPSPLIAGLWSVRSAHTFSWSWTSRIRRPRPRMPRYRDMTE